MTYNGINRKAAGNSNRQWRNNGRSYSISGKAATTSAYLGIYRHIMA